MSRYNYLLLILSILLVGWILFNQLILSTETASNLIENEIKYGLNVRISQFFIRNKRFPDSKDEIKKIVKAYNICSKKIVLSRFIEGDKLTPFKVVYILKISSKKIFLQLTYFGSDYIADYNKRGILMLNVYIP